MVTLLKNLKLCPKKQFSEKSQNLEFEFSCQRLMNFLWLWYIDFYHNLNFHAKNGQNSIFSIIKIFGAKIQIIQVKLACKTFQKNIFFLFQKFNFAMFDFSEYWIFGHNLRFFNSVLISAILQWFSFQLNSHCILISFL